MSDRSADPFRGARAPEPPAALRARVLASVAREIREGASGDGEAPVAPQPTVGEFAIDRLWESGVARLAFAAALALLVVSHLAIGNRPVPVLPAASVDGADWRAAFTALSTSGEWERLDGGASTTSGAR